MKKIWTIIFISCLLTPLFAQQAEIFEKRGKYGLKKNNEIIVKPRYHEIRNFKEGMAAFRKRQKWGFFNENGEEIVPKQYGQVQDFSMGLAAVCYSKDSKYYWGFINTSGEKVIPLKYEKPEPFTHELKMLKGRYYSDETPVYNTKGEIVYDKVKSLKYIAPDRYLIYAYKKSIFTAYTYIDSHGNQLTYWLEKGYILTDEPQPVERDSDGKVSLMDISCEPKCYWYEDIKPFKNGLAFFKVDYKEWGAINKNYEITIEPIFRSLRFSENVLLGELNWNEGEWIINHQGDTLAGPYKFKREFENGIAIVEDYFIDTSGVVVAGPFLMIGYFSQNRARVTRYIDSKKHYAYITPQGKLISQWYPEVGESLRRTYTSSGGYSYSGYSGYSGYGRGGPLKRLLRGTFKAITGLWIVDVIQTLQRGYWVNSTYGYYSSSSSSSSTGIHTVFEYSGGNFHNNRVPVALAEKHEEIEYDSVTFITDNAKFGYIDTNGTLVIDYKYEYAQDFYNNQAIVRLDNMFGVIDINDSIVAPIIYQELNQLKGGRRRAKKDEKWGFLDESGQEYIPFIYDSAEEFENGTAEVMIDSASFYINIKGKRLE